MFKELKERLEAKQKSIDEMEKQETEIIQRIEEEKKAKEELYLLPIKKKEAEAKTDLKDDQQEFLTILQQELDYFDAIGSEDKYSKAKQLLSELVYSTSFAQKSRGVLKEKSSKLLDYFVEIKDLDMAVSCLKFKADLEYKPETIDLRKAKYLEYLQDFKQPAKYTDKSKYIIGYGEQFDDMIKLAKLCGELDYKSLESGSEDIHYSSKTKEYIIDVATGRFGAMYKYLYVDGDFGHMESEREVLTYWHDQEYTKLQGQELEERTSE